VITHLLTSVKLFSFCCISRINAKQNASSVRKKSKTIQLLLSLSEADISSITACVNIIHATRQQSGYLANPWVGMEMTYIELLLSLPE
jgi:hypothetical protein